MSNSSLVNYTKISPNRGNYSNGVFVGYDRNHEIDTITIHCVVGQCTVESLGEVFAPSSRQASSNYGIGYDGRIGMYVEEKDRSWCSSSAENDNRAITIEVASDTKAPYAVTDKAYNALIELVTDICKRNNIKQLLWKADKSLIGKIDKQNMTVHRWFTATECPGDYLYNHMGDIANKVNAKLNASNTIYRVQVGAFSSLDNALAFEKKVKASGFDTYLVKAGKYYKVQVGAFSNKDYANSMLNKLKAKGFTGFLTTEKGDPVSTSTANKTPAKKSVDEIAKEVIQGKWGVGADRVNRLKQAGYDPSAVQAVVNKLMSK